MQDKGKTIFEKSMLHERSKSQQLDDMNEKEGPMDIKLYPSQPFRNFPNEISSIYEKTENPINTMMLSQFGPVNLYTNLPYKAEAINNKFHDDLKSNSIKTSDFPSNLFADNRYSNVELSTVGEQRKISEVNNNIM